VSVIVGKVRNRSSGPDNEHVFQTAEFSYRKTVSNISPYTQSTAWLNEPQQIFVQLRPSAVNTTLTAFAAEPLLLGARRPPLSTGAKQQNRRTPLLLSNDCKNQPA